MKKPNFRSHDFGERKDPVERKNPKSKSRMKKTKPVQKRSKKGKNKQNNHSNGDVKRVDEDDVQVVPAWSSEDDHDVVRIDPAEEENDDDEVVKIDPPEENGEASVEDEDEVQEEEEVVRIVIPKENGRKQQNKKKEEKKNKRKRKEKGTAVCHFPMSRVKRIARSEGGEDLRLSHEAVFLLNNASEKFIGSFCEDAYEASVRQNKNYVAYHHLSSIVAKHRRFEFLSDLIPEKIKAEDALEERKKVEQ